LIKEISFIHPESTTFAIRHAKTKPKGEKTYKKENQPTNPEEKCQLLCSDAMMGVAI